MTEEFISREELGFLFETLKKNKRESHTQTRGFEYDVRDNNNSYEDENTFDNQGLNLLSQDLHKIGSREYLSTVKKSLMTIGSNNNNFKYNYNNNNNTKKKSVAKTGIDSLTKEEKIEFAKSVATFKRSDYKKFLVEAEKEEDDLNVTNQLNKNERDINAIETTIEKINNHNEKIKEDKTELDSLLNIKTSIETNLKSNYLNYLKKNFEDASQAQSDGMLKEILLDSTRITPIARLNTEDLFDFFYKSIFQKNYNEPSSIDDKDRWAFFFKSVKSEIKNVNAPDKRSVLDSKMSYLSSVEEMYGFLVKYNFVKTNFFGFAPEEYSSAYNENDSTKINVFNQKIETKLTQSYSSNVNVERKEWTQRALQKESELGSFGNDDLIFNDLLFWDLFQLSSADLNNSLQNSVNIIVENGDALRNASEILIDLRKRNLDLKRELVIQESNNREESVEYDLSFDLKVRIRETIRNIKQYCQNTSRLRDEFFLKNEKIKDFVAQAIALEYHRTEQLETNAFKRKEQLIWGATTASSVFNEIRKLRF